MRIFIEPTEPLLFRTGRPFTAGENNFAESIFPPTPETFQGALRAMIAAQWDRSHNGQSRTANELFNEPEVIKLIGKREEKREGEHTIYRNVYGRFRVTGLTLGHYDEQTKKVSRLFPAPAHIIKAKVEENGNEKSVLIRLQPLPIQRGMMSNHPEEMQLPFPVALENKKTTGKSEPFDRWLTPLGLHRVLSPTGLPEPDEKEKAERKATNKHKYSIPTGEIYAYESRLGIGINDETKTTREGYLYQVQMIRMYQHYGFVVDIELGDENNGGSELPAGEPCVHTLEKPPELAFLESGWMTIGGEQRAARFRVLNAADVAEEEGISQTRPGHLLYFATPAYFKEGWLPAKDSPLFPTQPITAAINRYQPIGGWLLAPGSAGGASKLTRRCIPAGSVYYFDKSSEVTAGQPLTEYGWQIGYGIAYTGEY